MNTERAEGEEIQPEAKVEKPDVAAEVEAKPAAAEQVRVELSDDASERATVKFVSGETQGTASAQAVAAPETPAAGVQGLQADVPVEVERVLAARGMVEADVIGQIGRQAALNIRAGRSELTVQLYPPELGSVRVQISSGVDSVEGRIVAEHEGTRALIEKNIEQLRGALERAGIDVGQFDVSAQNKGNSGQAFDQPRWSGGAEDGSGLEVPPATLETGAMLASSEAAGAGHLNIIA